MVQPNNPLIKHFRQPALYIKLTSNGNYWREGTLELPVTGEIPVYPMTTKDEITLRTPDALLNGTSVVNVIQSCCPNIKDAWAMPSVDVDSTLIAIRIASFGQTMPVEANCPSCNETHAYDVNLSSILGTITMPDYSKTVNLADGLIIKLKPLNYLQISQNGSVMFEEEKLIQALSNPDISPEDRKTSYDLHVNRLIDLNLDTVVNCTESIATADGNLVTDPKFIKEYYANAESSVNRAIQEKIEEFAKSINIKPLEVLCNEPECGTKFNLAINFDYASFFDRGF